MAAYRESGGDGCGRKNRVSGRIRESDSPRSIFSPVHWMAAFVFWIGPWSILPQQTLRPCLAATDDLLERPTTWVGTGSTLPTKWKRKLLTSFFRWFLRTVAQLGISHCDVTS